MKTQGEQVDCMARSGLYHSRPASITSYTNELNTNRPEENRGNCPWDLVLKARASRRQADGVRGGGIPLPGEGGSPQKIFVILHFKWCIFMQFGVGIFTLKGV